MTRDELKTLTETFGHDLYVIVNTTLDDDIVYEIINIKLKQYIGILTKENILKD